MRKKIIPARKLRLHRDTLHRLDAPETRVVVGGTALGESCGCRGTATCCVDTYDNCTPDDPIIM